VRDPRQQGPVSYIILWPGPGDISKAPSPDLSARLEINLCFRRNECFRFYFARDLYVFLWVLFTVRLYYFSVLRFNFFVYLSVSLLFLPFGFMLFRYFIHPFIMYLLLLLFLFGERVRDRRLCDSLTQLDCYA